MTRRSLILISISRYPPKFYPGGESRSETGPAHSMTLLARNSNQIRQFPGQRLGKFLREEQPGCDCSSVALEFFTSSSAQNSIM